VLARLRELPGGPQLLDLAGAREDVELIGGATRDLLLGLAPRELDVVVGDDAASFAGELASSLGGAFADEDDARGSTTVHERFGTALVSWEGGRIDIAGRRAESYPAPGALPEVRAGTPEEDLRRRDFTINAIAVALGGPRRGQLRAVAYALEDLAAARMRVLHGRSFLDDPTRLFRLARYRARLRFEPEERTAELAAEALRSGAMATVSHARIGAELRLTLGEPDPLAALGALRDVGVLAALHPPLDLEDSLARRALALLPEDGRCDLLLLACLLPSRTVGVGEDPEAALRTFLDDMEFTAGDRDRALKTALLAPGLVGRLQAAVAGSQLREAVHGATLEATALAGALGEGQGLAGAAAAARRWLSELRLVRLRITGDDLLAAGVPAGPEIGHRLQAALDMRLDGELDDTPDAQLRAALDAPA
jgi:tRNA nucleotidyltransferase (CCA-adding enzyme)